MAESENKQPNITENGGNDVISELDVLSKKYGLTFDVQSRVQEPVISQRSTVSVPTNEKLLKPHNPPKNNTPAAIPRIVYDHNSLTPQLKIFYGNEELTGPEGRRVIYSEQEVETIAEKRKRNNAAQKSVKGSQGFGSQPYVRHVASSESAIQQDDGERFTRTYQNKKQTGETNKPVEISSEATTPKTSSRLVAANANSQQKAKHQHYELTAGEKVARFFKAFLPWRGDNGKEIARKLIMNISAIAILVCFGYFIDNYMQHQNKLNSDQNLGNMLIETPTKMDDDELAKQWAEIKAKYPDVDFPDGMNIKYAQLYATNQDLVGWLTVPGTNIDTPVVQSEYDKTKGPNEDNYYLRRNFHKEDDKYGNPFLDTYNTGSSLDQNNTIYGHNMTDGLSFAQLEKYYTIDGFKESPIIKYSTLYNDYYFKVYAVIITNGFHSGDNNYLFDYTVSNFSGEENFNDFIKALDERKLYDTGVDINSDDKLITLSTCSYEIKQNQMGRLAIVGRLVRPSESTEVDTSKAILNENVRYPQIWYDEHGIANPYKNADRWIPE